MAINRSLCAQEVANFSTSDAIRLGSICIAGWYASEMLDKVHNPSGMIDWPDTIELTGFTVGTIVCLFWPTISALGKSAIFCAKRSSAKE